MVRGHVILPVISRYFTNMTRGGRKKVYMLILMLVGNSLEIGCKMKIGFLVRKSREFEKKVLGYLREKVGFQFISGLFSGVIGIK